MKRYSYYKEFLMKILKRVLLILILSLAVIACEDEATNPEVKKPDEQRIDTVIAIPVGIDTCEYALVTELVGSYRANEVVYLPVYSFSFQVTVKLDSSLHSENQNSLSISSGSRKFVFNKQDLDSAYSASINGYIFDLEYLAHDVTCDSVVTWNIELYDNVKDTVYSYNLTTDFSKSLVSYFPTATWNSHDELYMKFNLHDAAIDEKIEVHYLNSAGGEISVSTYTYNVDGIKISNAPNEASKYYFIINDEFSGIKRKYTTGVELIPGRLPSNIDFIDNPVNPAQVEYIQNVGGALVLSKSQKSLTLINFSDNSIVWKQSYSSMPLMFAYSKEKNTVFLALENGDVYSINPADGAGSKLFSAQSGATHIIPTDKRCLIFYENNIMSAYNYESKTVSAKSISGLASKKFNILYNSYNNRIYILVYDMGETLYSYNYNYESDSLALCASANLVYYINHAVDVKTFRLGLSYDKTSLFLGGSASFECSSAGSAADLNVLSPHPRIFTDYDFISSDKAILVRNGNISIMNGSLEQVYNYKNLTGYPQEVCHNNGIIKVFSSYNGKLIIEKFNAADLSY